jgi:hypothetical protein
MLVAFIMSRIVLLADGVKIVEIIAIMFKSLLMRRCVVSSSRLKVCVQAEVVMYMCMGFKAWCSKRLEGTETVTLQCR